MGLNDISIVKSKLSSIELEIIESKNKNWPSISMTRGLSEEFIEEFEKFLDFEILFECQELSNSFKEKYEYKILPF